jgi:hypothetical protein
MTIGRIGGPMLKENLIRQGVDLSIETDLFYFDVNNMRVGVNTATPNVAMDINGITRFSSNLQINGSNIATYAGNGNITLSPNGTGKVIISTLTPNRIPYVGPGGTIIDSPNLTFDGTTLGISEFNLGNLSVSGNILSSVNTNGNINLDPNGTGNVIIETATATQVFYSGANKELITNANLTFSGTQLNVLGTANATTLQSGNIQLTTNTISSTVGNLVLSPTANVILNTATANTIVYAGANKELLSDSDLTFNGTTLQIGNITATGNTISSANANGNINLDPLGTGQVIIVGTNAVTIPNGDTSQRPAGSAGDLRFNSELSLLEFFNGTTWSTLVNSSDAYQFSESFNGDDSTVGFTLSYSTTSSGALVTLNGVVQSPGVAYSISGTSLTFTEAPHSGDKIDVRYISSASDVSLTSIVNGTSNVNVASNGNVTVGVAGNANVLTVSGTDVISSGTIRDSIGNVRDLINNSQSGAYILTATDNGKMVNITTGGVTVNAGIFSEGNNTTIYNNSGSNQTITQGTSVTMYLAGTATTGNRTLAQHGIAKITCVAANTFVIYGGGVT